MNFINIQSEDTNNDIKLSLKKLNVAQDQQDTGEDIILKPSKIELNITPDESEGCVVESKVNYHQCSTDYFAIKNLFSELTDDYQRAIIRQNLGISDDFSLVWGRIGGNLANQKDLYNFIKEALSTDQKGILETLNLELKYWTQQIENKIESLASNITSLEIVPRYAISNQLPVDVLVTWEYDQPVEVQSINGIALDPEVRNYIFRDVNESLRIRLAYFYNNVWLARNINFEVTFPLFYGTSANYEEDQHTIGTTVKVNAGEGEYIYILSRNQIDLSVNGLIGGFEEQGTTYIASNRYYIYKSLYPNLGETVIRVHDRE